MSGDSFAGHVQHNIFAPAGMTSTSHCDELSLVHGMSHAYRHHEKRFVPANECAMAYNADLRLCSTVGDL